MVMMMCVRVMTTMVVDGDDDGDDCECVRERKRGVRSCAACAEKTRTPLWMWGETRSAGPIGRGFPPDTSSQFTHRR
eukprot:2891936-Pyramimonas_sp.AAC.1